MPRLRALLLLFLLALAQGAAGSSAPPLELVETAPIETSLDHPDIPEAAEVWLTMIAGARERLDFAQFYASNSPGSRLETIVRAIEAAAARGVRVRFLAEEKFYGTYPETLDRLAANEGITVRRFDVASHMGGVLHAKYFLVDGREAYLGSQNFDWRALTHIQELGLRIREPRLVGALSGVFAFDWALAGEAPAEESRDEAPASWPVVWVEDGDSVFASPAFSPTGWLPDESLWDLPRLIELIDGAESTVFLQLLTYKAIARDGTYYDRFESALRRAAARGVDVRLQVSHWSKRRGTIEGLQSLQAIPGITVKMVTIPEWSGGFVPVVAPVGLGPEGAYNVNADSAAAALAAGLGAGHLFFLTDVDGLLANGEAVPALGPGECEGFVRRGLAVGGMIPKLRAAAEAARAGVEARIVNGNRRGSLAKALAGENVGTLIAEGAVA